MLLDFPLLGTQALEKKHLGLIIQKQAVKIMTGRKQVEKSVLLEPSVAFHFH